MRFENIVEYLVIEAESVWWLFGGYLSTFYLALSVWAALSLPSHPRPALGAPAYFVLFPALIAAISGEFFVCVSAEHKQRVEDAIKARKSGRRLAFVTGLVCGMIGVGIILAVYHTTPFWPDSTAFVVIALILIAGAIFLTLFGGLYWLISKDGSDSE